MDNGIAVRDRDISENRESVPYEDAVFVAVELGEHILRCGGEISRAEDTVSRICKAYGAVTVDVTVILSVIVLTVDFGDCSINTSRRITEVSSQNLGRLAHLNDLSRRVCRVRPSKAEFLKSLERIEKTTGIGLLKFLLGGFLSAAGFAVFFGGGIYDAIFSALLSIPMLILSRGLSKTKINAIISKLLVCFIGGCGAMLVARLFPFCNVDKIMIGDIMNVVPGVLITNSFRDLFGGDIMSGFFRMCVALVDAVAIACGYAVAILIFGGVI